MTTTHGSLEYLIVNQFAANDSNHRTKLNAAIADGIFSSAYGCPLEACTAVRRFVAFLCVHSARIPPFPDRTSAALHCSYLRQVRTKGMVQWRLLFTNT
jgi:hypothetical protein